MQMRGKKTENGIILKPEGDLIVRTAGKAHRLFQIGSRGVSNVTVDLSRVGTLDACGLQLLVHLSKFFRKNSVSFQIIGTTSLGGIFSQAGLSDFLTTEPDGEAV